MEGSTWILIFGIAFLVIGFVLTVIFGEKALNKAYSPGSEHGLFYGGLVLLGGGTIFLIIYIVMKNSKISSLTKENYNLYSKINSLQEQLGQCKGNPMSPKSSGPGFFSRIGGWFGRNTSVPVAGNS